MSYLHRTLEPIIEKASQRFKVVLVSGMRQVGKSTLLQHLSRNRTEVTLDDRYPLEVANTMREVFFQQYPPPVLIDEIQRSSELALEIKSLVDRQQEPGLVWLTGSQRFSVMKNVSESLAGRLVDFELLPLSLYEHQNKAFESKPYLPTGTLSRGTLEKTSKEVLWQHLWRGSWPELRMMDTDERDWFFNGLMRSYIERDLRQLAGIEKLTDFHRFLTLLASRIGQEFQIGKVASETGIAVQTARNWLSIAEASGIIYLLPPFYENIGKVVIKKPKLYFTDTGLAAWLAGITSAQALQNHYLAGAFFENFVVAELRKSWLHNGKKPSLYFYRDSNFNEIDVLIKNGNTYHPIEIKMTEHPLASMVKGFKSIQGGKIDCGAGALICLCEQPQFLAPNVVAHSILDI